MNSLGRERESDVGIGQLGPHSRYPLIDDMRVIERHGGQPVDREPLGMIRQIRPAGRRHQAQISRGDRPLRRIPVGGAESAQLFEVGDLAEIDLGREVSAYARTDRLSGADRTARQSPIPRKRRPSPTPGENRQCRPEAVIPHLQDHRQRLVAIARHFPTATLHAPHPIDNRSFRLLGYNQFSPIER